MGNFSPVTVHTGNFSSVTVMNKARPFKLHARTGLEYSYGKISSPVTESSVAKTEISVTRVAKGFCVTRDGPKISSVTRDRAQISRVMRDWTSQRDA